MRPSVTAGTSPFRIWRSEPQIVVVVSFTMTSVGAIIVGFGTSSRARRPGPWYTSAFLSRSLLVRCRAFAGGTLMSRRVRLGQRWNRTDAQMHRCTDNKHDAPLQPAAQFRSRRGAFPRGILPAGTWTLFSCGKTSCQEAVGSTWPARSDLCCHVPGPVVLNSASTASRAPLIAHPRPRLCEAPRVSRRLRFQDYLILEEGVRSMPRPSKYPPEFRERCVRIARESARPISARSRVIWASTPRPCGCGCAKTRPTTAAVPIGWPPPSAASSWPCAVRCATCAAPTRSSRRRVRFSRANSTSPVRGERVTDANRERFGVEPICREIEVSASAYRARRVRPPSARSRRDAWLLERIRRVHADSDGIYGQLKVWDELSDEGISVARCTVERLMRAHGIEGLRNGQTQRTTLPGLGPVAAPDLVRRDFSAERPDGVWLSDFTDIRTWEGWSYLSVVLDVHTRRIVGWQLASHMRQSPMPDALEMAIASRKERDAGTVAHSDNGSQ